ncbi:MAG: BamA/TamA family outer membrane protein [Gemmatimonadaceae bacterium]|nr:BamA/TamA family outer membrane protein [Gemmatimonadaceae bacterium]NUQ91687.1 BamA/TamA family outer membrane protein [Gemmatimonadaceae bacterium]NUR19297.1 BamA/TamA family outer membrane protein [Gemmatimonadaceae bacterium]
MATRYTSWMVGMLGLLASAPLSAQSSPADQPDNPEVVALSLRGVKAVEPSELQQSIATEASHCKGLILTPFCWISKSPAIYQHVYLDRTELRRDVLRIRVFYWKRGYREADVDTTVTPKAGGVAITFRITEGPPTLVRKIAVGPQTPVLNAKDIRTAMVLKTGKPLNLLQLDTSIVNLSNKLWERGYADAVVKTDTVAVDDSVHWADVSIAVDPRWKTTVGEIRVAGNEQVSEQTIRNSLVLHEGDLYKRSEVIESQRNLYESQLFRHAAIVVPPQGDSLKIIEVTVREAPLRDARISGGFNTVEFVQLEGRFRHYNFFGGARQLDLQGAIGNLFAADLNNTGIFKDVFSGTTTNRAAFEQPTWQASADIRQPWFQNARNTIALGIFAHRRSQPPVYIDRGEGASATFTREVAERAPASAVYRFEFTKIEAGDLYFCVYYGVCDTPTIRAQQRAQRLSPFAITAQIDRTNEAFSPTKGILGHVNVEHAASYTASDYHYARADADVAVYRQIGAPRSVLALHLKAGIARTLGDDALHPRKRFYAGGSQSVRGYGENQLGPRALTVPASKLATLYGCDVSTATIAQCNPNGVVATKDSLGNATPGDKGLAPRDFTPRPLGGTSLLEGSVEYRFPIWRQLTGAAFVDAGLVGNGGLTNFASGSGAVTPGAGIRYRSPVGPIRVDVAFNPSIAEDLPVYTERTVNGVQRLVPLDIKYRYQPAQSVLDRLTFHFSIGEAF